LIDTEQFVQEFRFQKHIVVQKDQNVTARAFDADVAGGAGTNKSRIVKVYYHRLTAARYLQIPRKAFYNLASVLAAALVDDDKLFRQTSLRSQRG
jgi:hypothetical protein